MKIMRNHVISNGVIRHEKKLNRSILGENKSAKRKIYSFTDILSGFDIGEMLSMIWLDRSDVFRWVYDKLK